jgi:hypothetical protein
VLTEFLELWGSGRLENLCAGVAPVHAREGRQVSAQLIHGKAILPNAAMFVIR